MLNLLTNKSIKNEEHFGHIGTLALHILSPEFTLEENKKTKIAEELKVQIMHQLEANDGAIKQSGKKHKCQRHTPGKKA